MMTVEDYMCLSKKRLAEMLVERDEQDRNKTIIPYQPALGGQYNPPCYSPGGICTNPYFDCINCPKQFSGNGTTISTDGTNL